ncbi:MAG TPA: cytidylate kinase family protein [Actinomycetaceae bacterium]|nr:cytidylate kinase family protein [Actinomycetaceae bacterium]
MSNNRGATTALKPVVTMWETYGSGMQAIAKKLSDELGLPLAQQAFSTEELDEELERRVENPVLDRVMSILARASSNTLQATSTGAYVQELRDNIEAAKLNTATVTKLAEKGGIIMGRSSTKILAGRPNTLHIKFDGVLEDRIARASRFFNISHDVAARRQRNEDDVRTRMSVEIYDWNPMNNIDFDLVVNTSTMTEDQIVKVVEAALKAKIG